MASIIGIGVTDWVSIPQIGTSDALGIRLCRLRKPGKLAIQTRHYRLPNLEP